MQGTLSYNIPPSPLEEGMRDVIYPPYRSRFVGCLQPIKKCKHFYVVDVFIITLSENPVNPLTQIDFPYRLGLSPLKITSIYILL